MENVFSLLLLTFAISFLPVILVCHGVVINARMETVVTDNNVNMQLFFHIRQFSDCKQI